MTKKKQTIKQYNANLDVKWSMDITVKAKNIPEAKKKLLAIFKRKLNSKWINFNIDTW